jgi:hypothetical protein
LFLAKIHQFSPLQNLQKKVKKPLPPLDLFFNFC